MKQFLDIDIQKLSVESPSGSSKNSKGSDRKDLKEGEDLASLP